jgi:hypothetical protein
MLSARLRHKVPREFEGMEDVLTSSVFALLRTLPRCLASYLLTKWADVPPSRTRPRSTSGRATRPRQDVA